MPLALNQIMFLFLSFVAYILIVEKRLRREIQLRQAAIESSITKIVEEKERAAMVKLAARVAHDLRNPIGTLQACLIHRNTLGTNADILAQRALERISAIADDLPVQNQPQTSNVPSKVLVSVLK